MLTFLKAVKETWVRKRIEKDRGNFMSLDSKTKVGGRTYLWCKDRDLLFTCGPNPTKLGCSNSDHKHFKLYIKPMGYARKR